MFPNTNLVVFAHVLATVFCYHVYKNAGIYGGDYVRDIKEAPFIASVLRNGSPYCGGSKIHKQFILTAAHCLDAEVKEYTVSFNSTLAKGPHIHEVAQIFPHRLYNKFIKYDYDIGLIKLAKPTSVGTTIDIAGANSYLRVGEELVVYGWGETINLKNAKFLRKVTVPIYDYENCERFFNQLFGSVLTSRMFCAGTIMENKDSCFGDSGGPLVKDGVQFGIVSFGYNCGIHPGIFTKLSLFTSWINDHIKEYSD